MVINLRVKVLLLIYLLIIHLSLAYYVTRPNPIDIRGLVMQAPQDCAVTSCQYQEIIIHHLKQQSEHPENPVYFLGDSITRGLNVKRVVRTGVNLGINGDGTSGLAYRISHYVFLENSAANILAIGINDLLNNHNNNATNIMQVIDVLTEEAPLVVSAILPIDETLVTAVSNEDITVINREIEEHCNTIMSCTFVDISGSLVGSGGSLSVNMHIGDGIHLSEEAYEVWISSLRNALQTKVPTLYYQD